MYLSCAAGYADVVVCERHVRTALHQSLRRLGRSTQVFRRLSDVIEPIAELLNTRMKRWNSEGSDAFPEQLGVVISGHSSDRQVQSADTPETA